MSPASRRVAIASSAAAAGLLLIGGAVLAVKAYEARSTARLTPLHLSASAAVPPSTQPAPAQASTAASAGPTASPVAASTGTPVSGPSPSAAFTVPAGYHVPDATSPVVMGYDAVRGTPILITGGGDLTTWKWDGLGWLALAPAHPAPAPWSNLAYDPALREPVMIAGLMANELWGWDGASWQSVPSNGVHCPSGGQFYLTFDAARNELLLLCNSGGATMSTWLFDGARWTKVVNGASPTPRIRAGIAYDPRNQTVVLAGGRDPMGTQAISETWTWDGASWTKHTLSEQPSGAVTLAYDSTGRRMVSFEQVGYGLRSPGGDWTWDGTSWTASGYGPLAGTYATLIDDPKSGGLLLFQGGDREERGSQTWLRVTGAWTRKS